MLEKIISGGQTGVDRAALDVAINNNITVGGWCPQGRIDELGKIPEKYNQLKEISGLFPNDKENYDARTKKNITDSDGTLIIVPELPLPSTIKDGTLLTIEEAARQQKPYVLISLSEDNIGKCLEWLKENEIRTLNIAGPRESTCPGIYEACSSFLENFFNHYNLCALSFSI